MQTTGLILLLAAGVIMFFGGQQPTYNATPTVIVPNTDMLVTN